MPTVLITGASRGLGLEFARQYAADGWQVIATCRDPSGADALQQLHKHAVDRVSVVAMDVIDRIEIGSVAAAHSSTAIDLLINNAGTSGVHGQVTGRVDDRNWTAVLDINALGPIRVTEAFTPHLMRGKQKLVVTISSGMGSIGDNTSGGSIAYRSSKAAVNMAMRSAAIDLRPRGISCVLVSPGWVATDMGGAGASLQPKDSVAAMRKLFAGLGPEQSGQFFTHDGRPLPW